tara:strand:- start:975 stop:1172 length:198 start_codon:yes stop_codon:yes gene_type:complete
MDIIAEGHRIKDRLLACQTKSEVETVANEEREKVMAMKSMRGDGPAMFHQIRYLKNYVLRDIEGK